MTDTPAEIAARNRRSVFNIKFLKGSKLRLVFAIMTAGMVISTIMLINVMSLVNQSMTTARVTDPSMRSFLEQLRETLFSALGVGLVFLATSSVISLLFGFMVSHRFYGPLVPLTRHLRELRDGKFTSRVRLRPGDELLELMEGQNELAESLEKKYGREK